MYNVHNTSNYAVPLTLDKGSITIMPGKYLDLDRYVTREFIDNSSEIQSYLTATVLNLMHDSLAPLPAQVSTKMSRRVAAATLGKAQPVQEVKFVPKAPEVIDLSGATEVEESFIEEVPVVEKPLLVMEKAPVTIEVVAVDDVVIEDDPIERLLKGMSKK